MHQADKSNSENDSSSDSRSGSSSGSDSESGSGSSSSSDDSQHSRRSSAAVPGSHTSTHQHQPHNHQPNQQHQHKHSLTTPDAANLSKSTNSDSSSGSDSGSASGSDDDDTASSQPPQQISQHPATYAHQQLNHAGNSSSSDSDADEAHISRDGYVTSTKSSPDDDEDYAVKKTSAIAAQRRRAAVKKSASAKRRKNGWNSRSSESDEQTPSDSDDEIGRRPAASSAAKKRTAAATAARKAAAANRRRPPSGKSSGHNGKTSKYSSDGSDADRRGGASAGRRGAAAAVSYKEASEDEKTDSEDLIDVDFDEAAAAAAAAAEEADKSETIERILQRRHGRPGVTGNITTVYAVEENGDPNAGAVAEQTEEQFLIKWKGWSHIHNTWESEQSLREQRVKGFKKLENYIKKETDIELWRRYAGPEDIDYFECQQELQQDLLKSYNFVDRIIAQTQKLDGSVDYLCKWESLPYAEATWEDASLVQRKWSQKIVEFRSREDSKKTPTQNVKVLRYRPKFHQLKDQPAYLGADRGLLLRDYQMDGLNWMSLSWCKDNSVILADEMGLGKTIQTISFLYHLFMEQNLHGPFLCVVPLSTMTAWQREFAIWAPTMNIVTYLGDRRSREIIRQYEWQFDGSKRLKFNAILTTYEIVLKDKIFLGGLSWSSLLVDEAHRLKNDDSLLYKALFEFDTHHRLLITGTPLQNSLKELWALLHFIMPGSFETWDDFERAHGNAEEKGYAKLHKQLEPFILRRVKKDVEKSLPAKVEQILRVEMTSVQKQYYKWILTKNFNALRKGSKGSTSTFLNIVIELKKCCNHAMLIRPLEYEAATTQDDAVQMLLKGSGKLVLLDKLLCRLRETGHRVLIFSQMVRMLDILSEYLQKRHFPFQRLDGSIKGELRKQALDHFNAEGSLDFCFLLSTRAGGLGINLATADTVIIFDSDWNPQNDLQAQARAHRIGQKNQVNIYRLVTARSVEEDIVERAKQKMVLDHLVIQRMDTTGRTVLDNKNAPSTATPFNKEDLSAILKFGAEELFKDEPEEEGSDLVCDIDEILRRAETRDEAPAMIGDELLSAFKVASFAAFDEDMPITPMPKQPHKRAGAAVGDEETKDWDDIIPEQMRKRVEEEERNKEMEDLYLPPRSRKTAAQLKEDAASAVSPSTKKKKSAKAAFSDDESGSDGSNDPSAPKRRGRPPMKEKFAHFNEADIRRFIKSYKKFPAPLKRLEAIAGDAELQEKPMNEIRKLAERLHERCVVFMEEHRKEIAGGGPAANDASAADAKKRGVRGGFSVKFGGVSFNAKTLMQCQDELRPLDEIMPVAPEDRARWQLDIKVRPASFDVDWSVPDDSNLLRGIFQYGIGSWEAMKMDPSLHLADKILSNDNKKPQAKHLQSRAEFLLKIMKKNLELKKGPKAKRARQPKATGKAAASATAADELPSAAADETSKNGDEHSTAALPGSPSMDEANGSRKSGKTPKAPKDAAGKRPKKKSDGPMHFTANNEPRALNVLGDLDPNVFNECKEKMRPVKKALKALDNPDVTLSDREQLNNTRACLLSIGKQIDECLAVYRDAEKVKEWRSNLWYFVSKFTEFDAKKLFKLYKHALKRSEDLAAAGAEASGSVPPAGAEQSSPAVQPAATSSSGDGRQSEADRVAQEKRERKERRRTQKEERRRRDRGPDHDQPQQRRASSSAYSDDNGASRDHNGHHSADAGSASKRKLEDGEIEPDAREYKRMHGDRRRSRDYGDRPPRRGSRDGPTTPQRLLGAGGAYPDARMVGGPGGSSSAALLMPPGRGLPPTPMDAAAYADGGAAAADRWAQRDRFGEHKRERYDSGSYARSPHGYPRDRDRDQRDRDRDRDRGGGDHRRLDKRARYMSQAPPGASAYANNAAYMAPGGYYAGPMEYSPGYGGGRGDRYADAQADWARSERAAYEEYRRSGGGAAGSAACPGDYDRRPPAANS